MVIKWYYKLILFVIFVAAIAGAFIATYEAGIGNGTAAGDKVGYKRGWDEQQLAVNTITGKYNALVGSTNTKISTLEAQAAQASGAIEILTKHNTTVALAAVETFKKANPTIINTCGWSLPTTMVIRNLLENLQ